MEYRQLKQKAIEIQKLFGVKGPVTVSILDHLDAGPGPILEALKNNKQKPAKKPRGIPVGRKVPRSTPSEKRRAARLVEKLINKKKLAKSAAYVAAAQKLGRSWGWAKAQHDKLSK